MFHDPEALISNIAAVTSHLRKKVKDPRAVLTLVPTRSGDSWLVDEEGEYWRMYDFVSDSISLNLAQQPEIFKESAVAFGRFAQQLIDFPAHTLTETIPHFHDTPNRYSFLHAAIKADTHGRVKEVGREIEFALGREAYASTLTSLAESGDMKIRVTHNDTKLNNVLFDRTTRKALCVIDLDTVMPGLLVNDYGDSIRFGASTALEDEQDLEKVQFSLPLFTAYTDGYLSACKKVISQCELEHLRDGAKMMTLECGIRFLTDYLAGDTYFHVHRPRHNLDRCRTQFKLVEDMEKHWDNMQSIILQHAE